MFGPGWRSSTAEQLICNQQVVGSSPIASSRQRNCLPLPQEDSRMAGVIGAWNS
jgi:hypothetical protein